MDLHKGLPCLELLPEDLTGFELLDQCGHWQALLPGRQKRYAEAKQRDDPHAIHSEPAELARSR